VTTASRTCAGTSKKTGKPCRARPLRDGDYCIAHDEDARASTGFGGPQPGSGRPRNPRPSEVARRLIEENVLALQRPYWRALGYDVEIGPDGPRLVELEQGGAKLHASFEGWIGVSDHDDLAAQIQAAEKLQDRVYGRPKQATEVSGPDGGPINTVDVSDPETRDLIGELLRRRPAARDE